MEEKKRIKKFHETQKEKRTEYSAETSVKLACGLSNPRYAGHSSLQRFPINERYPAGERVNFAYLRYRPRSDLATRRIVQRGSTVSCG